MKRKNEYFQIITSLPLLQGKIDSDFQHMTRISFDKHIKNLHPDDLQMLTDFENFVIWEKHYMDNYDDAKFKGKVLSLNNKYKNTTFLKIIRFIVQRRLGIGLFRKRKMGLKEAPSSSEIWAISDLEYKIKNNWNKKDFGLNYLGDSLSGVDDLIINDEALELEKKILKLSWDFCDKISTGHYFDIDFLLIYAFRRSLVERWNVIHNPSDVKARFEKLAMEAINGSEERAS